MNCKIHVYLINDFYSQDLADKQHEGRESHDNIKYQWEDEIQITSTVDCVVQHPASQYTLEGFDKENNPFAYKIDDMYLFEILSPNNPTIYVGASNSILADCQYIASSNNHTITIFLKDFEPMSNPVPGIFIASKSFPKELIQ